MVSHKYGRVRQEAVTKDEVDKVIKSLFDNHDKITVNQIKSKLGKGSYSSIGPFLRAWRKKPMENLKVKGKCENLERELLKQVSESEDLGFKVLELEEEILKLKKVIEVRGALLLEAEVLLKKTVRVNELNEKINSLNLEKSELQRDL
jgi:hypothetical protein